MSAQLRGHITVLHTLRETQLEQGARLDRLERRVDEGFARVDARFDQLTALIKSIKR